jgi:argininosuccinate synthase
MTVDPEYAPEEPIEIVVGLESGNPVSVDGESLDPV